MKKYDEEKEVYWEVCFFDTNEKLNDLYGNTEDESNIKILKEKAIKKGYNVMEITKVVRETTRYNL